MENASVLANEKIEALQKRFNANENKNLSATYLITIKGEGGGSWLTKISNGACEFTAQEPGSEEAKAKADCFISIDADDLEMILAGRMTAMTAAMSGILSIEGELGLAMQLVPVFFEGQAPFI